MVVPKSCGFWLHAWCDRVARRHASLALWQLVAQRALQGRVIESSCRLLCVWRSREWFRALSSRRHGQQELHRRFPVLHVSFVCLVRRRRWWSGAAGDLSRQTGCQR